jgi:streptogramin lyase
VLEGGILPIVGAQVNLMKIGTTGYGSDPGNDVGGSVTDSHGNYSINMPPCSPAHEVWYLSADGGNTGNGTNSRSRLIAVLGPCNQAPSSVTINEVTTVASTYAMSQFMNTTANLGQNIGAPSTNLLGAANASLTVQNLVNLATGTAPSSTLPAGATAPTAEINTLADVLATCVQADDTASTPCQQLNCVATPGGIWSGTSCNITAVPETTIDAMLLIARNPANNVGALFALATSTNYSPVLGSAPNDWTLGLKFVGGGLNSNFGLAVDGGGDVWVVNFGNRSLSKFSPSGVALSTSAGFTGGGLNESRNIAIDSLGNAWATAGNSVAEFDNNGNALSPSTGYTGGGTNDTYGIAIDSKDRVWASNLGAADISLFCGAITANCPASFTTGEPISPAGGFTGGGLSFSFGAAVDGADSVWTVNDGPSNSPTPNVSKFSSAGNAISGASGFTGGGLAKPTGVAIDPAGNAWACNIDNGVVSEFSTSGSPLSGTGFTGGGVGNSEAIAVDSANNVWVANESSPVGTVSEFNSAGTAISPSGGFQGGSMNDPIGIAIDASGNVWVSNDFDASITQLIGAAAPVKTPLIGLPTLP